MTALNDLGALVTEENEWTLSDESGLPLLYSPLLGQFDNLKHAFTTRQGGNSRAPLDSFNLGRHMSSQESRQDAMNNRRSLCQALGFNFEALVVPGQVHSKNVVLAHKAQVLAEVDGVIVTKTNVPVLLHFADCVPVVIFAPRQNVVSVVHAGWRGTAQRIVVEAIELMKSECDLKPGDLVAAVGPAIGPCCYPTGKEAEARLIDSLHLNDTDQHILSRLFKNENSRCHPNLKAINAYQLYSQGVPRVDISNACTACRPDLFYSHRQSAGHTGRQGVIACLV
jgi:polyphenol oxidase